MIDEEALVKALKEKKIAGAAIDVFTQEPITSSILFEENNIIVTPHLGASTAEAQVTAAHDVVLQIIDVFNGCSPRYAVNAPLVSAEVMTVLSPFIKVGSILGKMVSQLIEGQMKTIHVSSMKGKSPAAIPKSLKLRSLAGYSKVLPRSG